MISEFRTMMGSWIMKVLLIFIALTFVTTFGVGVFTGGKDVVALVNGEEILATEFLELYNRELESLREEGGEDVEKLAEELGLRGILLNRLIDRRLLEHEARRQELKVTDEEVRARIHETEAFYEEGKFNFAYYQELLRQNRFTPTEYERRVRTDLLVEKLRVRLQGGLITLPYEAKELHRIQEEAVQVEYVLMQPARFEAGAELGEAELKQAYEADAKGLLLPAKVRVRFFTLGLEDVQQAQSLPEAGLQRYYDRRVDVEFTIPEKAQLRQIFIPIAQHATPAQEIAAVRKLEDVRKLLDKDPQPDFAGLARTHSKGEAREKGGDLGFVTRDDLAPEVAQAAFALKPQEISEPLRSPQGVHLLKLEVLQPSRVEPFAEVRERIETTLNQRRGERKLRAAVRKISEALQDPQKRKGSKSPTSSSEATAASAEVASEGAAAEQSDAQAGQPLTLDTLAEEYGRPLASSDWFSAEDSPPTLGAVAELLPLLRRKKAGTLGLWRRNPVQGHVVYEVLEYTRASKMPFEEARAKVLKRLNAEKRTTAAHQAARDWLKNSAADLETLRAQAEKQGLSVQKVRFTAIQEEIPSLGRVPEFQRTAFGLSAKSPAAFVVEDQGGENKGYLLWFGERIKAKPPAASKERELLEGLTNAYREALLDSTIAALRKSESVEVLAPGYLGTAAQ